MAAADWAALPPLVTLKVFAHCATPKDAAAWRLACKSYLEVCGRVDMLQLRVVGEDKAAAAALDASSGDIATWFGLDLDFAPFELVQQVGLPPGAPPLRCLRRQRRCLPAGSCPPAPCPASTIHPLPRRRAASPRRLCCGRSRPSWWRA